MKMNALRRRGLFLAGLGLLGLSWSGPAWGQVSARVAAQQDGRALDANPGVGGRVNGRVETPDFRARNNLVTGNVSGGFGFRGDVGYTAPGDFRSEIGSDDLFDFRAESIRSAPNVAARFNGFRGGLPGQVQVFESSSDPTVNSFSSPLRADFGRADRRGLFGADSGGLFELTRAPQGGSLGQVQLDPVSPAFRPVDGLLERTSPLLGAGLSGRSLDADLSVRARVTGSLPADASGVFDAREPSVDYGLSRDTAAGEAQGQRLEEIDAGRVLDAESDGAVGGVPAAGLLLGQQMSFQALEERRREAAAALAAQSAAAAEAAAEAAAGAGAAEPGESDRPSPAERRIERQDRLTANAARESIYSSLRGKTEQQIAADPYLSLLRDLEQGIRTGAPAAAGSPERSGLEDMTPEAIRAAREARREAQRERLGDEQVTDAQLDAQSSGAGSGEVARLLRELDYDRPALSSLAPVESGLAVDEYVRRGEARMKAGNFLQAESTFREALLEEPDHVLAKAGLAHARLGAGMVRSAAGTLRQLFAAHPEVIALRYEPGLLPPPDRMRWLQRELTRMIERETAVAEAGLLLAYLGYQTGWPNVVQVGLDTSESAAVGDPLLPVVRRIWLAPENEAE